MECHGVGRWDNLKGINTPPVSSGGTTRALTAPAGELFTAALPSST